jgi:cyclase
MKRSLVLGGLVVFGALSLALGQQGSKALEVEKLRDNLYLLRGIIDPATNSPRGGGNTAVFVTSSGVVVVDTKDPGWGQPILDTIKTLTPKPVTMIINTHSQRRSYQRQRRIPRVGGNRGAGTHEGEYD